MAHDTLSVNQFMKSAAFYVGVPRPNHMIATPAMMDSAFTEPLFKNPRFSSTAPSTLSNWQPRKPSPATIAAHARPSLTLAENMTMLASKALTPMRIPPAAAAS